MLMSRHVLRGGRMLAMLLALVSSAAGHAAERVLPAAPGDRAALGGAAEGGGARSGLRKPGSGLLSEPEETFLHPDAAFVAGAYAASDEELRVRFDIAPGYYLYRERFVFAPAPGESFRIDSPRLPPGKVKHDEYFGEVEVYYREVEAALPFRRSASHPRELRLDVTYQGCADAGLCYPPIIKTLAFDLDSAAPGTGRGAAATFAESAGNAFLSPQDRVARSLAAAALPVVMAQFALFGLLLAFTPCVLPMVPILSAIVLGQRRENVGASRAFSLSLVYVLAMALTYSGAGVLAGLSGAGLQAFFQHPAVIVSFAALFVLLALSMFGLYRIQIPAAWQSRLSALSGRQRGGTWLGVAAMGVLSALIVGPCVAPPLAGALVYIAQTGDAQLGGLALFSLAMGMGVPLLVAGTTAGRLAPRAGPWMKVVERVFGVLLIGVAIYLLERVVPPWTALLLWALLFIVCAIYMGAFDRIAIAARGWRRLWKGAGLGMLVYGVLLMVGAASGGGDLLHPLKGLTAEPGTQAAIAFKPVKGLDGLEAELELAAARGQSVMLDFYADWCVSCKEMKKHTFPDAQVRRALAGTVLLEADVSANDKSDRALLTHFGLFGPPAILFFGSDGRERPRFRVIGFVEAEGFRDVVESALGPPAAMISAAAPGGLIPAAARGGRIPAPGALRP